MPVAAGRVSQPREIRWNERLPPFPHCGTQLDDIWVYIAKESGNLDTADRVLLNITDRFWLLAQQPRMGRRRDDLAPELRSFPAGNYIIVYSINEETQLHIHYVFHGNQDIQSFFQH